MDLQNVDQEPKRARNVDEPRRILTTTLKLMDFVSNQTPQIQEMLKALGISRMEELFQDIPNSLKRMPPASQDGISESEGLSLMESIGRKNTYPKYQNYLGAGAYEHYIPAIVSNVLSRQEFFTSYTPYQPEASQGMLQSTFEFQSSICALTGMDVANASVYDGASACAEALLMCLRLHPDRNKVFLAENIHPHYLDVIHQYIDLKQWNLIRIPMNRDGSLDGNFLKSQVDENTAGVLLQSPNFFGTVENLQSFISHIRKTGAYVVICANPLAYALFSSARELDADIAVGDTQPFGLPLSFGGPYAGYIACRMEFVRQLPGRIVGETVDAQNRRGFVLTLQAREQHIRREKATSNICTNQSLATIASLITLLWYGKEGLRKLALTNYQRSAYLKHHLSQISGVSLLHSGTSFNEFAIDFGKPPQQVQEHFRRHEVEPGISLKSYYPSLKNFFLVAVTETKSKSQLDQYISLTKELCL